jgi:uncharacterized protein (TIGR03086 family)
MPTDFETNIVALNAQAVRASLELVTQVTAADLGRPTPCAGWTLADLLGHLTTQHYGFAAASAGRGDLSEWQPRELGPDPVAAYRTATDHVLAAFAADGVLDRKFPLPEIRRGVMFPARQAISFHFIDYVVHSWDVARTLDLPLDLGSAEVPESALLEVAITVAQAVPAGDARLGPAAAFGPVVTWSGGSSLDHIVAILGRSPDWQRP